MGANFESNYGRLLKLRNVLSRESASAIKLDVNGTFVGCVTMSPLEETKFTETFLLEQVVSSGPWLNDPRITVRMYHDVRVAEVVSMRGHRVVEGVHEYPNRFMHHPDEKNQVNQFLAEWLNFCLSYGCCDQVVDFVKPA